MRACERPCEWACFSRCIIITCQTLPAVAAPPLPPPQRYPLPLAYTRHTSRWGRAEGVESRSLNAARVFVLPTDNAHVLTLLLLPGTRSLECVDATGSCLCKWAAHHLCASSVHAGSIRACARTKRWQPVGARDCVRLSRFPACVRAALPTRWLSALPWALWDEVHWMVVPLTTSISFLLLGIDEIGVQIEEVSVCWGSRPLAGSAGCCVCARAAARPCAD